MTDDKVVIRDEGGDRKYFTITPQVVWARARSPYDLSLWVVVKMIAGDHGECFLDTRELASLAMMSVGQVHDSRQYLLAEGLLAGIKTGGRGVWHLRIPDLWPANLEWRQELGDSLKDRVRLKAAQRRGPQPPDDRSPGERSPGEQYRSPGETKENHEGEPGDHPGISSETADDDSIDFVTPEQAPPRSADQARAGVVAALQEYDAGSSPEAAKVAAPTAVTVEDEIVTLFCRREGRVLSPSSRPGWIAELRATDEALEMGDSLARQVWGVILDVNNPEFERFTLESPYVFGVRKSGADTWLRDRLRLVRDRILAGGTGYRDAAAGDPVVEQMAVLRPVQERSL